MKATSLFSFIALCALILFPLATSSFAGDDGDTEPGVMDGSCWKDANGHRIKVGAKGGVHGDVKVSITDQKSGKQGSGIGDEDDDGGVSNSESIKCDGQHYRAKDGRMQRQSDYGYWQNMTEMHCEPNGGTGDTGSGGPTAPLGDDLGTLPASVS